MIEKIVGIGKIDVSYDDTMLISIGLGSCVGVMLYDHQKKIGGMAHVMLPNSRESNFDKPNTSIMISDQDRKSRKKIHDILEKHEFTVIAEAEESFETVRKYDALAMGMVMISKSLPELEGIETMKRIRQKDENSKIILISDENKREILTQLINQGANEVLLPPFEEENVKGVSMSVIYDKHMRFADIAVPVLAGKMKNRGANTTTMGAKLVGGANIFSNIQLNELGNIGQRNVEAVKAQLKNLGIPIISEDTGKNFGRTARFEVASGNVTVKTKGEEYII